MRPVVGLLGLVWGLVNIAIAYFFVTSAFVAKTAAKEGIVAQLSLLLGGVLIAGFAVLLARESVRLFRPADTSGTTAP